MLTNHRFSKLFAVFVSVLDFHFSSHFYVFRLWRQKLPDKALLVSGAVGGPTAKALDQLSKSVLQVELHRSMSIGPIGEIWHMHKFQGHLALHAVAEWTHPWSEGRRNS